MFKKDKKIKLTTSFDFINIGIYKSNIYLTNAFHASSIIGDCSEYNACVYYDKDDKLCIWFKDNKPNLGDICHESIHLAIKILKRVGVDISYDNDEALTYLAGYIFDELYKKLS